MLIVGPLKAYEHLAQDTETSGLRRRCPFKAWVLLGYPLYYLRSFVAQRVGGGMGFLVINGYVLSVGVLLMEH